MAQVQFTESSSGSQLLFEELLAELRRPEGPGSEAPYL